MSNHSNPAFSRSAESEISSLFDRVICLRIVGSRTCGLDDENSDTDYRGIYLSPADRRWSLSGVPEQIERDETEKVYREMQKFVILLFKSSPFVLESLWTPHIEFATPLARKLLSSRKEFL